MLNFLIHRKTFISMLFVALSMLGYISYKNLGYELYPSVELPVMIVQASSRLDVNPDYVEKNAIIPIEGAIGTLEGIESIDSYADHRNGTIFITYKDDTNTKYAFLKLEQKIESIRSSIAEEFTVNVLKVDTKQISNQFMDLQVRGTGGSDRIRNVVEKSIVDKLESVDGIATVEVFGGREKSIEIILDEQATEAYGITPSTISSLISANNQQKVFVGQVLHNNDKLFVNVTAENTELSHLENIIVKQEGPVRLKDIADIYFGVKDEESYSRVNGKESVTLRLIRDSQVNLIELSHATQNAIDQLNQQLASQDVEIVVQRNVADDMEQNIDKIIELALIGGLLAIIILWMFLRNFKLVVTIGLAIPISVFSAFNFFYAYDISINSLTLIGMALAIGMLLDNSIVVLENIYRLKNEGKSADEAVVNGTKQVWRSIFAATLTTITVFLPFAFSSNFLVKTFGLHIGVSIISTLLVSLLLAMLLIPIITHKFFNKVSNIETVRNVNTNQRLIQIYIVLLKASMRFPTRTIVSAVVIFFVSIFIALAVSVNNTEEVETDSFNLYIEMPQGSSLDLSDEVAREVESRLEDIPEKEEIISKVYEDQSTITINLKEGYSKINNKDIASIKEEIQNKIRNIGQAVISFEEPQSSQRFRGGAGAQMGNRFERMMGIGSQSERVVLKGSDYSQMIKTAEDVQYYLENLSSVQFAHVSVSGSRPEMHLLFNPILMSKYGITLNSVVSELGTFSNQFSSNTTFKQGTEEYDITIRTKAEENKEEETDKTIDDLRKLKVSGNDSQKYELQDVAEIIYSSGMSSINRVNQEKQVEISYSLLSEVNDSKELQEQARVEIDDMIATLNIPSGIAVEVLHDENEYEEYYFLIIVAAILIYMILAAVFESLLTPFVLMFSIPLAAIGSLLALIFTNNSLLNSNTLMGFLILLGIVVNNGIILIDYTNILRKNKYTIQRALVTAGIARVRPILITAITTIVGMVPLALGDTEYVASIGAPFAITVIGGLSVSTIFTLIFIPTFYSGLYSALDWLKKLSWKIKLTQTVAFVGLTILIYFEINSFIWQMVDLFLIMILVPGLTYFVLNSLRQASAKMIPEDKEITIEVKNVVKVYDQASRFIREWNRGKKNTNSQSSISLFDQLVWQLPLLFFLVYFVYFYLDSGFWLFVNVHILFFFIIYLLHHSLSLIVDKMKSINIKVLKYFTKNPERLFIKLFALFNLVLFQIRWDNLALVLIIGFVWYLFVQINGTSEKLFNQKFDESELTGKFSKIRRQYYSLVRIIPVIGRKRVPFRALNKVSLDIGNGMFGLLGPNGAGKTTIMRIICGIFEQSYGKVKINGIDRNEFREELQGLIGYLPQEFGMYENMSAYDFLNYQATLKGIVNKEERYDRVKTVLDSVHMFERKDEKIGSFSGGMKQRIGIAQILLHLPRILVVDEPTAGLDPRERIRFRNLLVELSRERIVIFSTHIIEDISSSCNRVAVMNEGTVRYLGDPAKMTQIADGKVWHFHVNPSEFQELQNKLLVVNHMRDGDKIRIRCISDTKPSEDAKNVRATLEDAYLCLQKLNNTSIFE